MSNLISKSDYKFVPLDPEEGFSAEHNRRVIQETIDKNNKLRGKKNRLYMEQIKGRTAAVAQYFSDLAQGKTESNIDKYFGPHELAKLRGMEIQREVRSRMGDKLRQRVINKSKHPDFVVN